MDKKKYSLRQIPKVVNYHNDGCGRDTYISFYNGGFGKYKLSDMILKEHKDSPKHYYYQNLALCKPTKRYFCNGGGRDSYVYISLLEENEKNRGNLRLHNILRSYDGRNQPLRTSKNISPSKFEKKLINRIFYGKCPGLKDRQMSPKVKFKRDIEKEKEEKEENKVSNNISLRNTFLKTNKDKENINIFKNNKEKKNLFFTPINTNIIKKLNNINKININQSEDLINSVKKIFLYNSKNKAVTEQCINVKV